MHRIRTLVFAIAISALIGTAAFAQVDAPPAAQPGGNVVTPAETLPPGQMSPDQTMTTTPRDDGFDWGWIGLLGLAGLAGLRRQDTRPVDRDTAYPSTRTDSTTTPRGVNR